MMNKYTRHVPHNQIVYKFARGQVWIPLLRRKSTLPNRLFFQCWHSQEDKKNKSCKTLYQCLILIKHNQHHLVIMLSRLTSIALIQSSQLTRRMASTMVPSALLNQLKATNGKPITCKAAVAWKPKEPLDITDIKVIDVQL